MRADLRGHHGGPDAGGLASASSPGRNTPPLEASRGRPSPWAGGLLLTERVWDALRRRPTIRGWSPIYTLR